MLAGMDIVAAVEHLGATVRADHGVEVDVRVGVHTGLVLVSDMGTPGRPDRDAIIGATPNEAARIQAVLQAAGRALTPLVGRGPELRRLHEHWHELKTRRSCPTRVVLITGEAGIGKSRLAAEIVRDVFAEGAPVLLATCSPDRTTSPLFPIVRLLEPRPESGRTVNS